MHAVPKTVNAKSSPVCSMLQLNANGLNQQLPPWGVLDLSLGRGMPLGP